MNGISSLLKRSKWVLVCFCAVLFIGTAGARGYAASVIGEDDSDVYLVIGPEEYQRIPNVYGRTMIPAESLANYMGACLYFDQANNQVYFINLYFYFSLDDYWYYWQNLEWHQSQYPEGDVRYNPVGVVCTPIKVENGTPWVPIRAVAEAYGVPEDYLCKVEWDSQNENVHLSVPYVFYHWDDVLFGGW